MPTRCRGQRERADRLWSAPFVLLCAGCLLFFTSFGMMAPTLPRYVAGPVGATTLDLGLSLLAFSVASLVCRIPVVRLSATLPSRTLLIIGALLLVPTFLLLLVPTMPAVYLARAVSGLADAVFFTMALTMVYEVTPRERHGSAMTYLSVAVNLGLLAGPAAGETIRVLAGFTPVWIIAAGLALVPAALATRLPATRPAPVTEREPARGPLAAFPAGALLPAVLIVLVTLGPAGFGSFVPLYADSLGQPDVTAVFVALATTILVVRLVAARWVDRAAAGRVAVMAFTLCGAGFAVIAMVPSPAGLLTGTVVLGVGHALGFPVLLTLAAQRTDPSRRTAVVAIMTACHVLAYGVAGPALGTAIQFGGFAAAFLLAASAAAVGLVTLTTSGAIRRPGRKPTTEDGSTDDQHGPSDRP